MGFSLLLALVTIGIGKEPTHPGIHDGDLMKLGASQLKRNLQLRNFRKHCKMSLLVLESSPIAAGMRIVVLCYLGLCEQASGETSPLR